MGIFDGKSLQQQHPEHNPLDVDDEQQPAEGAHTVGMNQQALNIMTASEYTVDLGWWCAVWTTADTHVQPPPSTNMHLGSI